MLVFPHEYRTEVYGSDGCIFITQDNDNGETDCVKLTIHQFQEIYNRSKHVIEEAEEKEGEV